MNQKSEQAEQSEQFYVGDRVQTPGGLGTVQYWRMAAPDYHEVAVYSIKLDTANHNALYSGTIYPAKEVTNIK